MQWHHRRSIRLIIILSSNASNEQQIMAKSSKRLGKSNNGSGSVKKKKQEAPFNESFLLTAMKEGYEKKRILIKAVNIYNKGKIPSGEENLLFQYHIDTVNQDLKTASITFDSRCIGKGEEIFRNYQDTDGGGGG